MIYKRIYDLVKGDVCTKQMKLGGDRFVVIRVGVGTDNTLTIKSRNSGKIQSIQSTNDQIIWLRNDPEA